MFRLFDVLISHGNASRDDTTDLSTQTLMEIPIHVGILFDTLKERIQKQRLSNVKCILTRAGMNQQWERLLRSCDSMKQHFIQAANYWINADLKIGQQTPTAVYVRQHLDVAQVGARETVNTDTEFYFWDRRWHPRQRQAGVGASVRFRKPSKKQLKQLKQSKRRKGGMFDSLKAKLNAATFCVAWDSIVRDLGHFFDDVKEALLNPRAGSPLRGLRLLPELHVLAANLGTRVENEKAYWILQMQNTYDAIKPVKPAAAAAAVRRAGSKATIRKKQDNRKMRQFLCHVPDPKLYNS